MILIDLTIDIYVERDLSETAIQVLPTRGLEDLEILRLTDTRTLKKIPSVYHYKVKHFHFKFVSECIDPATWLPTYICLPHVRKPNFKTC